MEQPRKRHVRVKSKTTNKGPVKHLVEAEAEPSVVLDSLAAYHIFDKHPKNSINRYTVSVQDMPSWYVHDSFIEGLLPN